jgi:hypothetical protein
MSSRRSVTVDAAKEPTDPLEYGNGKDRAEESEQPEGTAKGGALRGEGESTTVPLW